MFIASTYILDKEEAQVHLISFASTVQKRVVNSTIKAETHQLTDVVEAADLMRAALLGKAPRQLMAECRVPA